MPDKDPQGTLFDVDPTWREQWKEMPEFEQPDQMPVRQLIINFEHFDDVKAFALLVEQTITPETRSIWYPEVDAQEVAHKRWLGASSENGGKP